MPNEKIVSARVTADVESHIRRIASAEDRTVSAVARRLILAGLNAEQQRAAAGAGNARRVEG